MLEHPGLYHLQPITIHHQNWNSEAEAESRENAGKVPNQFGGVAVRREQVKVDYPEKEHAIQSAELQSSEGPVAMHGSSLQSLVRWLPSLVPRRVVRIS